MVADHMNIIDRKDHVDGLSPGDVNEKRASELILANRELAFQYKEKEKRAAELIIANEELALQNKEKEKRAAELIVANKELALQNIEKEKRAAELIIANNELALQNEEKEKRAAELIIANKELAFQYEEKEKRAAELIIANEELALQNTEKEKRAAELIIANNELALQNTEKEKRAAELIIANKELALQNKEKEKRAAELVIANRELALQNGEKEKRAAELIVANKELAFQNEEKEKRAAELILANKHLALQNGEKEKRAAELIIANKELAFQNKEKEKRAAELIIANKELAFQNEEKEERAVELAIANKELAFQNEEKEERAAELVIANKELAFQNEEKEKRAAELIIANIELDFQYREKEKRAAELVIANKELVFQNKEKGKRATELVKANKELIFQNKEKEQRATELASANKELDFQNEEKDKRAAELIKVNRLYKFLSQINQTIVQSHDEQTVFKKVCEIALEFGMFKVAWISKIDKINKKLNITAERGMLPEDIAHFTGFDYAAVGVEDYVIQTGNYYLSNDIAADQLLVNHASFAASRGWCSEMVLPIKKSGEVWALLSIISSEKKSFGLKDIALLVEAAGDISFALDVFEKDRNKKLLEDKVVYNELRLKQAQSIAHYGNWELDYATGSGMWSEEACRIYGIDPEDNIQTYQTWLSFIHPDDLEYVLKVTKDEQARVSNTAFHHRIIRSDGTIRHLYSQAHFEFNADGHPDSLYSVVHDITETKDVEFALERSESNLRQIMDLMPQYISARDFNGKFLFANKCFASLFGLSPSQLVNKTLQEINPVKDESEYSLEQDQMVISSGATTIVPEHPFIDNLGKLRLFESIKVPFTIAGNNEKAVLGISIDITTQKQAEAERLKMTADIVQRNKDLEQFSYIVSHNLRAPVANINGIVEILQMMGCKDSDEKELIGELAISSKKLDDVIMDLNFVLQTKHTENKHTEPINFSQLIKDIQVSIDNLIRNDDVQIICDFSEIDEMLTIKSYIYSILFNLISNSIKYRKPDVHPVIEITSSRTNNIIQLLYKDNGMGIDLDMRGDQVFGLYKRFHTHVDGKGMGLFMVKTQVESLGGKISIASEINKGTAFTIKFETN